MNTQTFIDRKFIESLIGTKINDIELYQRAFTHKSALKRYNLTKSFETLEFLGDSVLNFIITRMIIEKYNDSDEGFLTKLRTRLVRGTTLAHISRVLGISKFILMDEKGERNGWNQNDNILEDVFEALVGAIYSDIGLPHAKKFVLKIFENTEIIDMEFMTSTDDNFKDQLMRYCQTNKITLPYYNLNARYGNTFSITVVIDGYAYGTGEAGTKKQAEQSAAFETLKMLRQYTVIP